MNLICSCINSKLRIESFTFPSGMQSILLVQNTALTLVPFPTVLEMSKLPPVIYAACLKKGIPSPTFRVVRDVKNGSVTCCSCSSFMPHPSSSTDTASLANAGSFATSMMIVSALALTEFSAMSRMFNEIYGSISYTLPGFQPPGQALHGRKRHHSQA